MPPTKSIKAIDELTKHGLTEFSGSRKQAATVSHRLTPVEFDTHFGEHIDVLGCLDPALDQITVSLQVKLKSIDVIVKAKCLMLTSVRFGQVNGCLWQAKGV